MKSGIQIHTLIEIWRKPESRISVMILIIYFLGVPTCWGSKIQKGVILSCSEAEHFFISKVMKEISFTHYLLKNWN
jgi:hypothetical protein